MAKPETAVAVKEEAGALGAVIDFGADSGEGFEEADASSYAIPFLRVLQSLSPQCKKMDAAYVKGAEEGDFFNTVTEKIYKGEEGVIVVPCHYVHKFNAWAPRESGGGIKGTYTPAEAANLHTTQNERFQNVLEDGSILTDTRDHYVIIVNPDGNFEPALLTLSSTQMKKSKKWMSLMQGIRIQGQVAPMFSQKYKLSPVSESNDKGSWTGIKIEHVGQVDSIELYNAAKSFREMVRSGEAKATEPEDLPY